MRSRSRRRRGNRRWVAVIALCLLAAAAALLLSGCDIKAWLAGLWPFDKPPSDGNSTPEIVIYPGQVLKVPRPAGTAPAPPLPNPPVTVTKGEPGQGRVALTFDAGWEFDPAQPLLKVLRDKGLHVTFFPRGKWIEDHPDLARAILADGHEIGSHSYTHPHMTGLGAAEMDTEIAEAKQALIALAGEDAFLPLYRPPYGEHNAAVSTVLTKYGYGYVVMWQVDSLDWTSPGVDAIVAKVLDKVTDGGIVLMHIGTMQTVEALPRILAGLAERNLQVVRVSELLGLRGDQGTTVSYTVQAGDTLYAIARKYSTTLDELLRLNPGLKAK